jgi:hypothetical protein
MAKIIENNSWVLRKLFLLTDTYIQVLAWGWISPIRDNQNTIKLKLGYKCLYIHFIDWCHFQRCKKEKMLASYGHLNKKTISNKLELIF